MIALLALLVADDFVVVAERSSIKFTLEHKLHTVEGLANADVTGSATFEGADAQVRLKVPVKNFDTAHKKRDETMREVIEAEKFPFAEITGTVTDGKGNGAKKFVGQVTFHGVTKTLNATVTLKHKGDKEVSALCKFKLSLDAHGVERPSLMFVKVNDSLALEANIVFKKP